MATDTRYFDKDARVEEANPTTNYGSAPQLIVEVNDTFGKGAQKSIWTLAYVDFSDLTDLTDASQVTAATANMTCYSVAGTLSVYFIRTLTDWVESTVTWNTRPGNSTDHVSDVVSPVDGLNTWDITDMIKDAITNRASIWNAYAAPYNYGAGSYNSRYFYSLEASGLWPYITIEYTVGGVTMRRRIPFV